MTGVSPIIFWIPNIFFDVTLFGFSLVVTTIVFLTLDGRESFTSNGATGRTNYNFFHLNWESKLIKIGPLILILALFCFCGVMMSYIMSFWANSPSSGFALAIIFNILAGETLK